MNVERFRAMTPGELSAHVQRRLEMPMPLSGLALLLRDLRRVKGEPAPERFCEGCGVSLEGRTVRARFCGKSCARRTRTARAEALTVPDGHRPGTRCPSTSNRKEG